MLSRSGVGPATENASEEAQARPAVQPTAATRLPSARGPREEPAEQGQPEWQAPRWGCSAER
jgi:hypothetical protein